MGNGKHIVAIDLGSNTVAAAVGTVMPDGRVRVIDCEIVPVQGMNRSEIKNIDLVAQSIKQTLDAIEERQDIAIREAVAGISGPHIRCVKYPYYVFVGRDSEIREEDVQKLNDSMSNVQAPDGETIIQIIPQSYIVDQEETSNPVGAFGNKLEATFNFVLGDNSAVTRLKRVLSRLEVKQTGLLLNALASAEAVTSQEEREEGVAVIDIGGGTTDVTVFHDNMVRHVAIIPIGGNAVNKDIRSYGILERHVENLKVKYGCAMRDKAPGDKFITTPGLNARVSKEISFQNLAAIIEARMLDIIDYAMEQVKASGYADKLGAGVVLTGGASRTQDLEELFKTYTGIDVRVASPEAVLDDESVPEAKDPAFSTVIGLLLKSAEGGTGKSARRTSRPAAPVSRPFAGADPEEEESGRGRTLNDRYRRRGTPPPVDDEDEDDDDDDTPRKGGLFGRLKKGIENVFNMDVIEDNEI